MALVVFRDQMIEREEIRGRLSPFEQRLVRWIGRDVDRSKASMRSVSETICLASTMGPREENQDRVVCLSGQSGNGRGFTAIILCDGIGGLANGGACADLAIAVAANAILVHHDDDGGALLEYAVQQANIAIHRFFSGRGGATLSAILLDAGRRLYAINIGDSRVYTRRRNQSLVQV